MAENADKKGKKQSSSKTPKQRKRAHGPTICGQSLEAALVKLVSSSWDLRPVLVTDAKGSELNYSVHIETDEKTDAFVSGFCDFLVEQKIADNDEAVFTLQCKYLFVLWGLSPKNDSELLEITSAFCHHTVAAKFHSFFETVVSHAGVVVPKLPIIPETESINI